MNDANSGTGVSEAGVGLIDFAKLWNTIKAGKWLIGSYVTGAIAIALAYLLVAEPIFRSDSLLQIEQPDQPDLAGAVMLRELTGAPSSTAATVVQLIRSRSVLGDTVERLNLTTEVEPKYFPLFGYAIARFRQAPAKMSESDGGGWFSRFLWTRSSARINRFIVPEAFYEEEFTLRALSQTRFELIDPNGEGILAGTVGEVASTETAAGEQIEVFVSSIGPGRFPDDYTLVKHHWLEAIADLQERLAVAEVGRETGIVRVSLEGTDADRVTQIVNSVSETYLRQTVEVNSAQAERRLSFLEQQLPELQRVVEAVEADLNYYQSENRALALGAQAQSLLDQVVDLERRVSELQLRRVELTQSYTDEHPYVRAIDDQVNSLRVERGGLEVAIAELPETQREMLGLQRSVEVNTGLYVELLNSSQELRILKAGTIGDVRIVDPAVVPVERVKPQTLVVLAVALLVGGFLGVLAAFVRRSFRNSLVDPVMIERDLGLPILASIPFCRLVVRASRNHRRGNTSPRMILARDHPDELAIEALRSLRTSLHFSQPGSGSSVIVITGPSPSAGKSFVSTNLAVLLAEAGKRVVLIDGDLRKGRLHEFQAGNTGSGMSEFLSGEATLEDVVREVPGTSVTLITRGEIPPNPSELLMQTAFSDVVRRLQSKFDFVLIDAPPVLAVTDAAVIASVVPDTTLYLVVRAGVQRKSEVEEATRRLLRQQRKVSGVILNGVRKHDVTEESEHGYYYQYEY
ncbi:MAG: polysaccharide biosynthesis tyrosine autokinase [Gammaproteobacteria bacterium]|nr:polysaccharide biosynthesis tyrosine autokinase [Gammaproteobacteria bacterium]